MRHRRLPRFVWLMPVLILAVIILSLASSSSTQAQIGGTIGYGSNVFGSIAAAGQSLTYSFNGSTGDFVQITLRNWTGTLDPHLDLLAPGGQTVASSGTHLFSDEPLEAFVSSFLPQAGIYSLRISAENNTTGEFVLKLMGRGGLSATPLVFGQVVDVALPVNTAPQFFSFDAQDCPTVLVVYNLSEGLPFTFPFVVKVQNTAGTEIAQLYGGDALEDRLIVAPSSGHYELNVSTADPQVAGRVQLLVTCGDQAPGCIPSSGQGEGSSCRPCFGDAFGGEACADFSITYTLSDSAATFTWTPVEGADWYIFSIVDAAGSLLLDSARLIEGATSNTYTFNSADMARGPFTVYVSAGAEDGDSEYLCVGETQVSLGEISALQCTGISVGADIVPGAERAAVLHWNGVAGAGAYLIHVYAVGDDGGLVGIRVLTVPGDATTYHLTDMFPSEYEHFQIRIAAYAEASGGGAFGDMPQGFACDGSTDIVFEPLGPVHWGPAA